MESKNLSREGTSNEIKDIQNLIATASQNITW